MTGKLSYVSNASIKGLSELTHTFDYILYVEGNPVLGVDIHEGVFDELSALAYALKRIDVGFRITVIVEGSVNSGIVEMLKSLGVDVIPIVKYGPPLRALSRRTLEVATS